MIDPKKYQVGPDARAEEIDLETTEVYTGGQRLTPHRAEQIAAETLAEVRRRNLIPGGKSLSGEGKHSPTIQFRVPESVRARLERQAATEGVTASKIARKALEEYLTTHQAS